MLILVARLDVDTTLSKGPGQDFPEASPAIRNPRGRRAEVIQKGEIFNHGPV